MKCSSILSRDIGGIHALDHVLLLKILSDNIKHFLVLLPVIKKKIGKKKIIKH